MSFSWPAPDHAAIALLPVLGFLLLLLLLDSYKLIRARSLALALGAGVAAAAASYGVSALALGVGGVRLGSYSALLAPAVEEAMKALVIIWLARSNRIGFLVDAAILGFAVGSGFALVENLSYLRLAHNAELATWITRGLGTAVMHGGATAILAVMGLSLLERRPQLGSAAFVPGWVLAAVLHGGFNLLARHPPVATLVTVIVVPMLLMAVFHASEQQLGEWLGEGFDADADLLQQINAPDFAATHAGQYLQQLQHVFSGERREQALRYLRVYTQLALRAKGVLMAREHELPPPPLDAATLARLDELQQLERELGAAGRRAIKPLLRMSRKELWQINHLRSGT